MKIGLVIFRADPTRGGAERYTADLAVALAARGHSVALISSEFGLSIPGISFIELAKRAPTRLGRYTRFLDALDSHLQASNYDIMHAMLPVRRCDIYHPHAGLARENLEARVVNRLNGIRRRFASVENDLVTGGSGPIVLCLSDYVKASVARHYPGIEPRLEKLFNAVDLQRFDPEKASNAGDTVRRQFSISDDAIVGLMIAQDFVRKGLPAAIEAIAKTGRNSGQPELKLLVVGKQDPSPYARQARSLGVEDRIIFCGSTAAPADFYRAADFFVLPTKHDPCSLVVLEALAMGLPVISTVFNGACEIMRDGEHGFVLQDPADVPGISSAMTAMFDSSRRDLMRQACLALRPSLSFEAHVDHLERIYATRRVPG
ncbi:MAG: glycosyltransferase family 4 protein [Planctomycetota bacterium]|nr:glycosyltransferase family 4 protein [Planctomycetota bacterium]